MSKILKISAHNFVTYKDFSFDLSDDSSVFIGGDNRDAATIESNGVGKSLIYDAIVWGLYDVTVRGFGKDQVVGSFDTYCSVTQEWKDDEGRIIRIRRYRKHPTHHNEVLIDIDGIDSSKVTTIKKFGTNAQIVKLIGIDSVSFLHSIVFSKGRGSICDEKEAGRRKLLSHIMNLERFDDAQAAARYDKRQHEKLYNAIEVKYASKRTEKFETKARIEDAKRNLLDEQKRVKEQSALIKKHEDDIKSRKDTYEKELISKNKLLKKLLGEQKHQKKLEDRIEFLDDSISRKKIRLGTIESQLATARQNYETALATVVSNKKKRGTRCPTCLRPISAAHIRKTTFELKKILAERKTEKSYYARKRKKCSSKISNFLLEREQVASFIDRDLDSKIYRCQARIKDLNDEIQDLKPVEIKFENHVEKYTKQIDELSNKSKDISREMQILTQKRAKVKTDISIADFWIDGFGSKGIKKYIINGILDYLESKANEYLYELTEGYMKVTWVSEKELKTSGKKIDKLLLHVTTGSRGGKEYHHCSKGEQSRVWLAMELALNSLIRSTIDLALVDEAFDGLDSAGVTRAIKLLSDEGTRRKLLCISHTKGIDKFFEKKKLVIMERDTSRLEDR